MKRLFILCFLLIPMLIGFPAYSADFHKPYEAMARGDYARALKEWTIFGRQGHAKAQWFLGMMYYAGIGVTKDDEVAVKWYTLAADQGEARAQFNLGGMYGDGQGVTKDYKAAAKWYRLAAEQGEARPQLYLGWMYYNGRGVPQDYFCAHMWFNIAASQGNEFAIRARSLVERKMTTTQIGTAQNLASEWITKHQ